MRKPLHFATASRRSCNDLRWPSWAEFLERLLQHFPERASPAILSSSLRDGASDGGVRVNPGESTWCDLLVGLKMKGIRSKINGPKIKVELPLSL